MPNLPYSLTDLAPRQVKISPYLRLSACICVPLPMKHSCPSHPLLFGAHRASTFHSPDSEQTPSDVIKIWTDRQSMTDSLLTCMIPHPYN